MFEADTSSPLKLSPRSKVLLIWANQEPDSQHLQYQLKIKSQ